jgi:L-asparaginase / beta-aspartyl-peptidase
MIDTRSSPHPWSLVIHGGAGVIRRQDLKAEQEAAYREALAAAAEAGAAVLRGGGRALDAVEAAVVVLEDDPLFNAGCGAVFTAEGKVVLDASIMDGTGLAAGAVAGVSSVRHPISLARAVMERSRHVMLIGAGAEAFAAAQGFEPAPEGWFFTERRWRALEKALAARGESPPPRPKALPDAAAGLAHDEGKLGTVGAVACDAKGHLAAATSTGGMTAQQWGRVGDSPVIGAGTYADDASCAVSGTGEGEYFIRLGLARSIAALVALKGMDLQAALDQVIHGDLKRLGGEGGVIAVGPDGQTAWSFNTEGMYRARIGAGQPLDVGLYAEP